MAPATDPFPSEQVLPIWEIEAACWPAFSRLHGVLSQAKSLLEELGQPRAHFVLEYAIAEARHTNFEMRHLGAILGYLDDALRGHER